MNRKRLTLLKSLLRTKSEPTQIQTITKSLPVTPEDFFAWILFFCGPVLFYGTHGHFAEADRDLRAAVLPDDQCAVICDRGGFSFIPDAVLLKEYTLPDREVF